MNNKGWEDLSGEQQDLFLNPLLYTNNPGSYTFEALGIVAQLSSAGRKMTLEILDARCVDLRISGEIVDRSLCPEDAIGAIRKALMEDLEVLAA